jgi:hypothetical protein
MNREQVIQICAEASHEANRVWCKAHGDDSQTSWADAPEWQKISAVKGVEGVLAGNSPEESHESWLKEKAETGWKYGPVKDVEKKEHPCFKGYADLPPEQRHKDTIFVSVVKAFAEGLGLTIEKKTIQAELIDQN